MENTTNVGEIVIFQGAFIATTVLCFIATLIISVGNVGLLYALYKNLESSCWNSASFLLFMNLVISDFLTGVFVGSLTAADAFIDIFGQNSVILDSCIFLFGGLLLFVNNLTITAMSFDRLIAVVKPLLYRSIITSKRIKVLIAVVWILSLLLSLLPVFQVPQWLLILIYSHSHATIPLVLLTIVYGVIFRSLKKQRRDFLSANNNEMNVRAQSWEEKMRKRLERDASLTVTIAMVMVLFCLSSFPFVIGVHVLTYIQNCDSCLSELSTRVITSVIYFSARCVLINSALDPFLLTLRMPKIRRAVRKTYAQRFRIFSKSVVLPQLPQNGSAQGGKDARTHIVHENSQQRNPEEKDLEKRGKLKGWMDVELKTMEWILVDQRHTWLNEYRSLVYKHIHHLYWVVSPVPFWCCHIPAPFFIG